MKFEEVIREDLWKSVAAHFVGSDYTEAVRDAMFLINEIVREKSGLVDKDGTKLMDAAFLGSNASLLLNKNETTTEKDLQQGIGFIFKGLSLAIRNPISHEKTIINQQEAEAILIFTSYLLDIVDQSKGKTKIDDWMELLKDVDFTASKEYAELLMQELLVKKRFDLLLEIYRDIESFRCNRINHFLNLLLDSLTNGENKSFIEIINKDLMLCKDDSKLRMFLHYFTPRLYESLSQLVQLRIEDLIKKSIIKGEYEDIEIEFFTGCNKEGYLATWAAGKVEMFKAKESIINLLFKKLETDGDSRQYVFKFFSSDMFNSTVTLTPLIKRIIHDGLKNFDEQIKEALSHIMEQSEDSDWKNEFEVDYAICRKFVDACGELPF